VKALLAGAIFRVYIFSLQWKLWFVYFNE